MYPDAHRQRIINWINATDGTSSAFDVTTKVLSGFASGMPLVPIYTHTHTNKEHGAFNSKDVKFSTCPSC